MLDSRHFTRVYLLPGLSQSCSIVRSDGQSNPVSHVTFHGNLRVGAFAVDFAAASFEADLSTRRE